MKSCTATAVRNFILDRYAHEFAAARVTREAVTDDFNLLARGVVDSMGVMQLISDIENEFDIEVDLEALDVELLTVIGPLTEHVARVAVPRNPVT